MKETNKWRKDKDVWEPGNIDIDISSLVTDGIVVSWWCFDPCNPLWSSVIYHAGLISSGAPPPSSFDARLPERSRDTTRPGSRRSEAVGTCLFTRGSDSYRYVIISVRASTQFRRLANRLRFSLTIRQKHGWGYRPGRCSDPSRAGSG